MSEKHNALRIVLLGLAVFLLIVLTVIHYGDQLEKINWRFVSIATMAVAAVFALCRWQMRPGNGYDAMDMFKTGGRADLVKHLIGASFVLAAWVIVQKMLADPEGDITGLITIVLATFVGGNAAAQLTDAIKYRPPATPAPSQDIHITAGVEAKSQAVEEVHGQGDRG